MKTKIIKVRNPESVSANASGDRQHTLNESGLPQTSEERRIQYETKRAITILQHPEVLRDEPLSKGESAHTPLPWKSTGTPMDGWHVREARPFKNRVGLVASTATKADADFIASACNSYEETAAERDKLREQVRELLIVCKETISARLIGTDYDQDVASAHMKKTVQRVAEAYQ